jgi:very-short-patch-repair endonuclease
MTDAEKKLWVALRRQKLNFRRQVPIGRYIADFCRHESRLIVELDGGQHAEPTDIAYDAARTEWLESRGYRVLRFWNADVHEDVHAVIDTILASLSPPPGADAPTSPVKGEVIEALPPCPLPLDGGGLGRG